MVEESRSIRLIQEVKRADLNNKCDGSETIRLCSLEPRHGQWNSFKGTLQQSRRPESGDGDGQRSTEGS
ncbi:unnamed protein product, partial [Brenthis ino]